MKIEIEETLYLELLQANEQVFTLYQVVRSAHLGLPKPHPQI